MGTSFVYPEPGRPAMMRLFRPFMIYFRLERRDDDGLIECNAQVDHVQW